MSDTPRKNYKKNHDHSKKGNSTASTTRPRNQIVPEVKGPPAGAPRKTGPKAVHRKDITLPPTVADAAKAHADDLGMSHQDYFNSAVVAFFQHVLVGEHTLVEPLTRCPTCGHTDNALTKPNAPPESGFMRVRVGVRFTDGVVKMLFQLSEDWFKGTWSHAFEHAVRHYLGKKNPPPEGKGKIAGVRLPAAGWPKGRPRKKETAEERVLRELAGT